MRCFCGCDKESSHRNSRDCYIEQSAIFDTMAPTRGVYLGVTRDVMDMLTQGLRQRAIRAAIVRKYAAQMVGVGVTPYPPE